MDIVKLFEKDVAAKKKLAEPLVGEHDVRLAIINAVLREVATKSDLEKLRGKFRGEISRLEQRIDGLGKRVGKLEERVAGLEVRVSRLEEKVAGLEKRFDMLSKFTLALNTLMLVAVIGILLKMVLAP